MARYRVTFVSAAGARLKETIEAEHVHHLRNIIEARRAFLLSYKELNRSRAAKDHKIPERDLILIFDLLSTLLGAAVTTLSAFDQLKREPSFTSGTRAILSALHTDLESSQGNLSSALAKYPTAFPPEIRRSIEIGEGGGSAAHAQKLAQIRDQITFNRAVRKEAITAAVYPFLILACLAALISLVLFYLLPRLSSFLELTQQKTPPGLTRLIHLSAYLRSPNALILLLYPAAAITLWYVLTRFARFNLLVARTILHTPFGRVIQYFAIANIASNFRALYLATEPADRAFAACAGSTKNLAIKGSLVRAQHLLASSVVAGGTLPLTQAFSSTGYFPPLAIALISTGEQGACLPDNLQKVATYYLDTGRARLRVAMAFSQYFLLFATAAIVGYVTTQIYQLISTASAGS